MRLIYFTGFSEQFPYRLLRGIYRYGQQNNIPWVVCRMPTELKGQYQFKDLVNFALEWKADWVIGSFAPGDNLQEFRRHGIVVMAQDLISLFPDVPNITADYKKMGRMVAERFVTRGFREFAFVGNNGMCWSDGRRDGFCEYLEEAGYGGNVYVYSGKPSNSAWFYRLDLLCEWLQALPKPVGVFACDDNQATKVSEACKTLGLRIPYDVAIVGVDNDEILCNMSDPPISSIEVDIEKGGYEAAAMAVRMMQDPSYKGEDIVLHPLQIITRESSNLITTKDAQVCQALTFIHSNITRKILVKDVREHVPLSRRLLEQRFLKATGKTIYQYISELRIDYLARLLLETDEPVSNLAARMDEPDPKSLSRRFKELKGCTPSAYRKKNMRKSGT